MKKIKIAILATMASVIVSSTAVYASFPVKNESKNEIRTEQVTNANETAVLKAQTKAIETKVKSADSTANTKGGDNEMLITLLLWFFLGGLAAHRWYKGKPAGWNILYIITLGGCGVWAIVDLINIITGKF